MSLMFGSNYISGSRPVDDADNILQRATDIVEDVKKTVDENCVHIDDSQTITGEKTFTYNTTVFKDLNHAIGTYTDNTWANSMLHFRDNTGTRLGRVQPMYVSGTNIVRMGIWASDGNTTESGIYVQNDGTTYAPTPSVTDKSGSIATTSYVRKLMPAGIILPYAGSSAPSGWLLCNGSTVSRTTYADLYAVIGTTYGTGDGSTTFGLPNLQDKTVWGANGNLGTTKTSGLPDPAIDVIYRQDSTSSGVYTDTYGSDGYTASSYSNTSGTDEYMQSSKNKGANAPLAAIPTNSIYGSSTIVQPPAICLNFIIKY